MDERKNADIFPDPATRQQADKFIAHRELVEEQANEPARSEIRRVV